MAIIGDDYWAKLNSDDRHDEELSLFQNKSHGGTMVIWKRKNYKYVTIHHIFSLSFLPIIFSPPGSPVSVHFCLFLPTSGQEAQFIDQLSQLSLVIEEIQAIHPG